LGINTTRSAPPIAGRIVLFLAGSGEPRTREGQPVVVINDKGRPASFMGTDQTGAGFLVVKDDKGKDVFLRYNGQQVYAARQSQGWPPQPSAPAPTVGTAK